MPQHHKIPKSRGGTDDDWNLTEVSFYEHAYEHALDFVLFENSPRFDFRQPGWTQLPEDLKEAVLKEQSRRQSAFRHTEETKKRISESLKGRPYIPRECSAETREKRRQSMLGKKKTPEMKENSRQAALKRWAKQKEN